MQNKHKLQLIQPTQVYQQLIIQFVIYHAANSTISTINDTIRYISSWIYYTIGPYTQISSPLKIDNLTGENDNIVLSISSSVAYILNSASQFNLDITVIGDIINTNLLTNITNTYNTLGGSITSISGNGNTISDNVNTISRNGNTI